MRESIAVASLLVTIVATQAVAQTLAWPQRSIRIIAGNQAGSATDNVARIAADALAKSLGVAVVVENRSGAGGKIGAEAVARGSSPDGYTLLVGGASNLVFPAVLEPDLAYDPVTNFAHIGRFARVPYAFAVHPSVAARSLTDFVRLARAQPGKLTYVSLGAATTTGYGSALLLKEAGIDMLAIEYRGIASAIPDILAGRVHMLFNEVAVLSHHAQGLRILATASPRRTAKLPDVPTTAEQGYPRVVVAPWFGLLAPAAIPPAVRTRLDDAYAAALRFPEVQARVDALGYELVVDAPGQFASELKEEIASLRSAAARR